MKKQVCFFNQRHCVKSVRIRSFFGPYFPTFGLNTKRYEVSLSVLSPNAGKYGSEKLQKWTLSRSEESLPQTI